MNLSKFQYVLLSAFLATSIFSCQEDCGIRYDLEAANTVAPARNKYTRSDTIFWTFSIPTNVTNRSSSSTESIVAFDVGLEFIMQRIDQIPDGEASADNLTFNHINIISKSDDVRLDVLPNSVYMTPVLTDSVYTSSINFTFKEPGVYATLIRGFTGDAIFVNGVNLKDNITLKDGCADAIYSIYMPVNNGEGARPKLLCDYLFIQCETSNIIANPDNGFHETGTYVFEVNE